MCEQGARELLHGSRRLKRIPHDGGRLLPAKPARECAKQRQGAGPVGTWGFTNNADYQGGTAVQAEDVSTDLWGPRES